MEDVIERLRKYVMAHPEMTNNGLIKGLDPSGKVVVMVNNEERRITIDELENGLFNQAPINDNLNVQQPMSNQESAVLEEIEVMEDVPTNNVEETIETLADNNVVTTLQEFQNAVIAKDEQKVNKALESFAIDEKTGSININKAIKIVTDNSTNNVISSIRDNISLPNDLSKYDVTGKIIGSPEQSTIKEELENLVNKSFNNILVYVEAARLKNIVYNEAQIEAAKKKYATGIQDKINVLGLNKKDEIKPDMVKEQPKEMTLDLQPDKNIKKAGFADILILTIIVLIYAAIIINLITKLK